MASKFYLKGTTIYLTKQASKLLGMNAIYVDSDIAPRFDQTREVYSVVSKSEDGDHMSSYDLSKEAILFIEYHHGNEELESVTHYYEDEETAITLFSQNNKQSYISLTTDGVKILAR